MIIFATMTPDKIHTPSSACILQKEIQAKNAICFDINAACSGFLYALKQADAFIKCGDYKLILVVGSEVLSTATNWNDKSSCVLFGDGAGVALLERVDKNSPSRIIETKLGSNGYLWNLLKVDSGGSNYEITPQVIEKNLHKMQIKGREIFKLAVNNMSKYSLDVLSKNNFNLSDVNWIIPHQANLRIVEAISKKLEVPMEKMLCNIDKYGNTSAASIPIVLDEAIRNGKIKKRNLILMTAFGAGLTFGATIMRF